jgi:hypothetical protein
MDGWAPCDHGASVLRALSGDCWKGCESIWNGYMVVVMIKGIGK